MQKLGRFFLLLNPESHKGQYLSKKRKREREGEREREREIKKKKETCFVESYLRGKLMAWSLAECSSSFFRYHYTKGADAAVAVAASLSQSPFAKPRRKDPSPHLSPRERNEARTIFSL